MRKDIAPCGNWFLNAPPVSEMFITETDKVILRDLAQQLKTLADREIEAEKVKLWTAHNDLKPTRPLVFADPENGWNEIIPWATLRCEGSLAKDWEMYLRKEICWGENFKDDRVLEAMFYVPYAATTDRWGLAPLRHGDGDIDHAYTWEAPMQDFERDFEKMHYPVDIVDDEASAKLLNLATETFDGILTVKRRHKWWHALEITLDYANMRGLEQMLYDFYDYPDEMHKMMDFFSKGYLARVDDLEKRGYLNLNTGSAYVGSGGFGFTEQLPSPSGNLTGALAKDMWVFCESQETSEISADMFAEFILPYQIPMMERFGLGNYGCCEAIDPRWEHVKKIKNLRRVSVSAWANRAKMAEYLGKDYVYSYKPSPSPLASKGFDEDFHREHFREFLQVTKGCNVEIIMKDNHTLANTPENLYRWIALVKDEINRIYG